MTVMNWFQTHGLYFEIIIGPKIERYPIILLNIIEQNLYNLYLFNLFEVFRLGIGFDQTYLDPTLLSMNQDSTCDPQMQPQYCLGAIHQIGALYFGANLCWSKR